MDRQDSLINKVSSCSKSVAMGHINARSFRMKDIERARPDYEIEGVTPADSSDSLMILSALPGFVAFSTQLAENCRLKLRIFSNTLDINVYGNAAFVDACSAFARQSARNVIHVLVRDAQKIVEDFHPLVRLQQRLPDKIKLRRIPKDFDPENIHQLERQFMVGDDDKILLQHNSHDYEGFINLSDRPCANEFTLKFEYLWNHAEVIPELQRLGL